VPCFTFFKTRLHPRSRTLCSFGRLAVAGVQSITYYETTGWTGVMEAESGNPMPEYFPSLAGTVFPLYHVFADIGEFQGGTVQMPTTTQPLEVQGVALSRSAKTCVLVANLSSQEKEVRVLFPRTTRRVRIRNRAGSSRFGAAALRDCAN
jgi:hypothetical protein